MNRLLLLVLASLVALSASAGAGYLVVIGPAPLRFEGRARPVPRALALLPPLLMQDPLPPVPTTNVVAQTTATNTTPETVTVAPPAPVVTNLPIATTLAVTNPPVVLVPGPLTPTGPLLGPLFDPNDPNSLLTAQMLIHYFRPLGTNASGASIVTPHFTPPRPASPPSSTVRYSTP